MITKVIKMALVVSMLLPICCTRKNKMDHVENYTEKSTEVKDTIVEVVPKYYVTNKRGDKIEVKQLTQQDWSTKITKEQYELLSAHKMEEPYSNDLWENKEHGYYLCKGCDQILFSSKAKFKSGTGWPSFTRVQDELLIDTITTFENHYPIHQVYCKVCNSFLGHLYHDGPPPGHKRYSINSLIISFLKSEN